LTTCLFCVVKELKVGKERKKYPKAEAWLVPYLNQSGTITLSKYYLLTSALN
jgi:hypothetical protein